MSSEAPPAFDPAALDARLLPRSSELEEVHFEGAIDAKIIEGFEQTHMATPEEAKRVHLLRESSRDNLQQPAAEDKTDVPPSPKAKVASRTPSLRGNALVPSRCVILYPPLDMLLKSKRAIACLPVLLDG